MKKKKRKSLFRLYPTTDKGETFLADRRNENKKKKIEEKTEARDR